MLLLGLLVARPQLGGGGLIGSVTHHVVLLDDSASMSQISGSATLYDRAQDRIRALADDLAETRSGDLISVLRTSRQSEPDLWKTPVGPELGRRVGAAIKQWSVTDRSADVGKALGAAVARAGEVAEASRTHYYLVGDQRQFDFVTDGDKPRPALQAAIAAMDPEREHLTLLAIGGEQPNLAIVDVELTDRLAVANVPVALAVGIKNFGLDTTLPTTLTFQVDGQSSVTLEVPPLAPGQRLALPATHTFATAGFHRIEARLEPTERFPLDDRRAFAIEIRERSRVLLVDGDPDTDDGETFFLQAAFDPDGDQGFGIEPTVVTDTGLGEIDLAPFDFVWLCNVQAPSEELVKRLEAFVASGGGLAIFCGDLVDPQRYNELLWQGGKGLLPLPLLDIDGDPDRPERAVLVRKDHPVCGALGDLFEMLMSQTVLVHRWLGIDASIDHDAAIVARIRDTEGPPLLVTRSYGAGGGEVALFATSADSHWTNLPVTPLFVPIVMELHKSAARRRDLSGYNLGPESSYFLTLDPGVYRSDVTVRALAGDGDERTFTAVEPKAATEDGGAPAGGVAPDSGGASGQRGWELTIPMAELRELGAYEVELARHDGVPEHRMLARSAAPDESRLQGFAANGFARAFPEELQQRVTFVAAADGFGSGPGEGEIWKLLAGALVLGLLAESFFAMRFGRR